MLSLLLKLCVGRLGEARRAAPPAHGKRAEKPKATSTTRAGQFSAADVQLSSVLDAGVSRGPLSAYPNLARLHERMKAQPAYRRRATAADPMSLAAEDCLEFCAGK